MRTRMQATTQEPLQTIKGYELREQLGAGGFGAVYRAFQPVIEREVAIKVILPEYANRPEFIRNFELEARLVARLEHPHIVPLFDFWRDPNGAYIVMRWIRGGSLRSLLDNRTEPFSPEEVAKILEQTTSALHTAHRNNVVHRDIKPENILLDEDNNAYITDFGIALQTDTEHEATEADEITGSLPYMPPEQIQSQPPTPQADVYSMGFVLFEMLTGQYPFEFENMMHLIMSHMNHELPSVLSVRPDLPEDFDEIIHRATAKTPEDRYTDIRQMGVDFRRALHGEGGYGTEMITIAPEAIVNPYKGLRAFDETDSEDFFGRDALVQELIDGLMFSSFMAVVGPSGSGKSSVVHAGFVPRLRQDGLYGFEDWFIVDFVPGTEPLQALESALLGIAPIASEDLSARLQRDPDGLLWAADKLLIEPDDRLMIVIDQFEELFTLVEDEAKREQFMTLIQKAVSSEEEQRVHVVLTLRADFYDRPLYYEGFGSLIRKNTHVVLPMSAAEIERAITGPAERVGLEVNSDLVAAIVADVQEEPGALPLLQYALTEVFERRDGTQLTRDAYEEIGGVTGALARRADEVFEGLTPEEQAAAQQVFLRLVTLGEGTEDTRRRVYQAELVSLIEKRHVLDKILETFGRYRLLTFDTDPETRQPVVEVAHEAIIREWARLRTWLNESRNDVHLQRILAGLVREWDKAERDESYLLRGARLAQFEEWVDDAGVALSDVEREFVYTSVDARDKQLQQRRRVQLTIAGVGVAALVVLSVLSVFALRQSNAARLEANNRATAQANSQIARETSDANAVFAATSAAAAQSSANRATALLLASEAQQALETDDSARSLALALEAYRIGSAPAISRRVLASAAYAPGARKQYSLHEGDIRTVAFTPGGQQVVTGGADNRVLLVDVNTGEITREFEGHYSPVNVAIFNEDGTRIVSGDEGGVIILWDVASGEPIMRFEGHTRSVTDVDFGPFDASIVSSSDDGSVILWDTFSGEEVRRFEEHSSTVWAVDFSQDGTTVISSGSDNMIYLWSAASGDILTEFAGHTGPVLTVAFSPDGTQVLSGSIDNTVILWDAFTGEQIQLFAGHTGPVRSVAFSADQTRLLSGAGDGLVIMWSLPLQGEVRRYQGHTASVNGIAFRPNSEQLASVSSDQTLMLWDTVPGAQIQRYRADTQNLFTMAYGPDGETALTSSDFHRLQLFDVQTGEILRFLDGHTDMVWGIAYSPDGTRVVSGANNGEIMLWDLETGELIRQFDEHGTGGVWSVDYSPDGETVITGSDDRSLIVWDVETGAEIRRFDDYTARVRSVAYSPDGTMVLGGSDSGQLKLWDIESGEELQVYEGHRASVRSVVFSPDGERIVSGSDDTQVFVWDTLSAEILQQFVTHQNWVTSVDITPDGDLVVSASEDGTVILWDLAANEERWRYDAFEGGVWKVFFGPAGDTIMTGFGSGMGRENMSDVMVLWRVDSFDEMLTWIEQNRVVQAVTCEERLALGLVTSCEVEGT